MIPLPAMTEDAPVLIRKPARAARPVCDVCRAPLEPRAAGGRPAARHRRCAELARLLSLLENEMERLRPYLPHGARRRLRSQLWYLANLLNRPDFVGEAALEELDQP
jgi:hypothetical protein